MYSAFWNLREAPFRNVADPRFAYLCEQHHEGLVRLIYMARTRKLGGVLTGPYGIGKSMLLELLAQDLRRDNASQFISMDCMPGKPITAVRHILTLMNYAEQAQTFQDPFEAIAFLRRKGTLLKHTVLAIDEAQSINDPDFYNFLLLLTNITFTDRQHGLLPAFTIILVGTGELHQAVMSREFMSQRLPFTWNLEPLNQKQVVEYVQHRIRVVGGDIWIFDTAALDALSVAQGTPRLINNICDVALMLGYAANLRQINLEIMQQAVQEIHGQHPKSPAPKA